MKKIWLLWLLMFFIKLNTYANIKDTISVDEIAYRYARAIVVQDSLNNLYGAQGGDYVINLDTANWMHVDGPTKDNYSTTWFTETKLDVYRQKMRGFNNKRPDNIRAYFVVYNYHTIDFISRPEFTKKELQSTVDWNKLLSASDDEIVKKDKDKLYELFSKESILINKISEELTKMGFKDGIVYYFNPLFVKEADQTKRFYLHDFLEFYGTLFAEPKAATKIKEIRKKVLNYSNDVDGFINQRLSALFSAFDYVWDRGLTPDNDTYRDKNECTSNPSRTLPAGELYSDAVLKKEIDDAAERVSKAVSMAVAGYTDGKFKHLINKEALGIQGQNYMVGENRDDQIKMLEDKLRYLSEQTGIQFYAVAVDIPYELKNVEQYDKFSDEVLKRSSLNNAQNAVLITLPFYNVKYCFPYSPYESTKSVFMAGISTKGSKVDVDKTVIHTTVGEPYDVVVNTYKDLRKPYYAILYAEKVDGKIYKVSDPTSIIKDIQPDKWVKGQQAIAELILLHDKNIDVLAQIPDGNKYMPTLDNYSGYSPNNGQWEVNYDEYYKHIARYKAYLEQYQSALLNPRWQFDPNGYRLKEAYVKTDNDAFVSKYLSTTSPFSNRIKGNLNDDKIYAFKLGKEFIYPVLDEKLWWLPILPNAVGAIWATAESDNISRELFLEKLSIEGTIAVITFGASEALGGASGKTINFLIKREGKEVLAKSLTDDEITALIKPFMGEITGAEKSLLIDQVKNDKKVLQALFDGKSAPLLAKYSGKPTAFKQFINLLGSSTGLTDIYNIGKAVTVTTATGAKNLTLISVNRAIEFANEAGTLTAKLWEKSVNDWKPIQQQLDRIIYQLCPTCKDPQLAFAFAVNAENKLVNVADKKIFDFKFSVTNGTVYMSSDGVSIFAGQEAVRVAQRLGGLGEGNLQKEIAKLDYDGQKEFLDDWDKMPQDAQKLLKEKPELVDTWRALDDAGRSELKRDVETLQAFSQLQKNTNLIRYGINKDELAKMLKAGWGGKPEIPSFKSLCNEVNELLNALPVNTQNLKSYMGSAGFTNAASSTQRHSYLQLQRLLENRGVLSKVDMVIFENEIPASAFNIGKSVSDVRLVRADKSIVEIETKAGMEFFSNLGEANFMTQSGNSLMTVAKIEDYKVFLNPGLVDGLNKEAAIKKVVNAWSKQGWFKQTAILDKFKRYGQSKGFDFADHTVEDYLKTKTDWFDEIFIKNISIK